MQNERENSHKGRLVYIATFGCQMNVRDSEALAGLLIGAGYDLVDNHKEAEVILINTCSVREHAEDRVIAFASSLKTSLTKNQKPKTYNLKHNPRIIGIIGCMAKNRGEELFRKLPHVHLICSPAVLDKIPEHLERIRKERVRIIDIVDRVRDEQFYKAEFRNDTRHAQVVISTGCSNYCSYCVVPLVRGNIRLRYPQDILDEVKRNLDLGITKITLLGQNVNDYFLVKENTDFVKLVAMIEKIPGIEKIYFLTNHPRNTSKELFELMKHSSVIQKNLHLPFQSGSDRILELMNRGYTKNEYLSLVEEYKSIVGGTLGTDIIVGFPTETEEDFLETQDIVEKVRFDCAYIFKYSIRPNTKAALLTDDVSQKEKERRHKILLDLQRKIAHNRRKPKQ